MNLESVIDRNNYIPYYIQLKNILQEQIDKGDWQAGAQLPGEPELCRLFDVSRTVVRQALKEMEYEGLIFRKKGKGTFVTEAKIGESLVQNLTGFYQDMVERGHTPVTQMLRQEVVPASPKVAGYLQIEPDTPVIVLDRLRFVQGEPIALVTTYLPFILCSEVLQTDLSNQSLYAFLEKRCGLMIVRGHRTLEAVLATEQDAQLLRIKKGAPLMMLDSISYLEDGTPLEYYHARHSGSRVRFEVDLVRTRKPGEATECPSRDPQKVFDQGGIQLER